MRKPNKSFGLLVVATLLLAACASREPAPIEERDLAGEVRREAAAGHAPIEVYALSDPGGLHLLEQARAAEASGQVEEARRLVKQALELTPDDPEYWQYLAELDLQSEAYQAAVDNARRSFELGPQIGPLCYRNWLTRQHAQEAMNHSEAALRASQQAQFCLAVRVN